MTLWWDSRYSKNTPRETHQTGHSRGALVVSLCVLTRKESIGYEPGCQFGRLHVGQKTPLSHIDNK